jgi:magnesium-protoporphyrin O-methyltransferase
LPDMLDAYAALAARTRVGMAVTFAPRTPLLSVLHAVGKAFPRRDRAPSIEPVAEAALRRGVATDVRLTEWSPARTQRIQSGFYKSQALEIRRHDGAVVT